ncbi:toxin VasX [Marinobacter halotolerans]|uniref:toxin VasX n=1 Tax=Marinobacter halotolerans TaxID=1569211 RepID=UPI001246361C|nr:toxin VasX [Marinobacter halotolerans]
MGSANSSAFLQGDQDIDSAAQVCPLQTKTVALYPVRWAISQEEVVLPSNFRPPNVALGQTHYCVRKLTPGWVYMFSEIFETLLEYQVNEQGLITEVQPVVNSVLLPDVDAQSALPAIHHPAEGKVLLKFVQHRWTARLQELVRTDAQVREEQMQPFNLSGLPENREGVNLCETEALNGVVEDFRPEPMDFEWSRTAFAIGISESDLQGQCKKETEFSYCVALDDEIGITSELGQLHALHVNLMMNYAEENAYAYTTSQMVDALIAREASKKESDEDRKEVTEELKERIRSEEKDAFVENYHNQLEEYDQSRGLVFIDWKRWIDSERLARKLEFNDCYCAEGFKAVEQELADILDGYIGAEKGKEDAENWLAADEGEAGTVGNMVKTALFLAAATNGIAHKLRDLPGFDYGSQKIVDSIYDMPAYVRVSTATETLMLEFAAPAAKMGVWAKDPQTWPQWKKWINAVQKRYGIDLYRREGVTLDTAADLLVAVNRKSLEDASGHNLSGLAMTPLAAGMADARIRSHLRETMIDMFHLAPDFKDNPFGWLHTRLDPMVEHIKQNRGKFIGAVTFFHAVNVASLFSGLDKTHQDVMLGDRTVVDRWGGVLSGLWNIGEGVVNLSGLLIKEEYAKALGANLSNAGTKLSVVFNGFRFVSKVADVTAGLARVTVKTLPYLGVLVSIGLEGWVGYKALGTGHHTMVALSGVQIGLSIGITYLATLAVAGAVSGAGVAVVLVLGAVLVAVSFIISIVQLYIARSRIEDFLSLSFWGNAPVLRYWDGQTRPSGAELLESSKTLASPGEGREVREYFEAELDAFYYMLFSPIVRITEHIGVHWDTNRGEHQIMSEMTSFVVFLPGYSEGTCRYSIKLFEVETNWFEIDDPNDITALFDSMTKLDASTEGVLFRFDHYNHNKCDQLELLIEYEKDDRKVTGDTGLRIILNGNDVEELGVDERLAFEV